MQGIIQHALVAIDLGRENASKGEFKLEIMLKVKLENKYGK